MSQGLVARNPAYEAEVDSNDCDSMQTKEVYYYETPISICADCETTEEPDGMFEALPKDTNVGMGKSEMNAMYDVATQQVSASEVAEEATTPGDAVYDVAGDQQSANAEDAMYDVASWRSENACDQRASIAMYDIADTPITGDVQPVNDSCSRHPVHALYDLAVATQSATDAAMYDVAAPEPMRDNRMLQKTAHTYELEKQLRKIEASTSELDDGSEFCDNITGQEVMYDFGFTDEPMDAMYDNTPSSGYLQVGTNAE